jgi:hypothetical protein
MSTAYWAQWSHAEIMSLYGIELPEVDTDVDQLDYDTKSCQEEEEARCCSSGCMDCFCLSWRDFM